MPKKSTAKSKTKEATNDLGSDLSFEEALEILESTVAELEDGKLGLNEAMEKYEKGIRVLKLCYQTLKNAEQRIELLSSIDGDGNVQVKEVEGMGD